MAATKPSQAETGPYTTEHNPIGTRKKNDKKPVRIRVIQTPAQTRAGISAALLI
jgi:hypothetical protein